MPQPRHFSTRDLIDPEVGIAVKRGILLDGPVGDHDHDFTELVLVESGRADHAIGGADRGSNRYDVGAGDLLVVAPGERHAFAAPRGLVVTNLLFTPEAIAPRQRELAALPGLMAMLVLEPVLRAGGPRPHRHLDLATRRAVSGCLAAMEDEIARRRPGWALVARSRLVELLVLASRGQPAAAHPGRPDLATAARFMEERLGERLTLRSIAARAGLSPQRFCSRFHAEIGATPMEFLRRARIAEAQRLLSTTDAGITAIALDTGFADASHLARIFRSVIGMSPAAWRRQERRTGEPHP